jgi:hypothetical protein
MPSSFAFSLLLLVQIFVGDYRFLGCQVGMELPYAGGEKKICENYDVHHGVFYLIISSVVVWSFERSYDADVTGGSGSL